ncbi:translation initiation factor [Microcoleus sp. FACHB-1515]|uniref:translation initiation factor n=1 Tax=Cyanophyceae TaxID=3028117 RepID=UPI001687F429|nr:translation initiation factor [Microcoleus sp. FACHB-1515]MBD2092164.1 translation initiation factor [Microcoleus sp. FACHB-1515]
MASAKRKSNSSQGDIVPQARDRIVYSEFGDNPAAFERATPDLPPNQQNLRVQASRKGRGGKTVTVISGFQSNEETLTALLKKLKAQCGAGGTLKDNEIEIQGDHAQKLTQILVGLGYKAKVSGGSGK